MLLAGALWDAVAIATGHDTLTRIIRDEARERTIFVFVFGLVAGHLFWP